MGCMDRSQISGTLPAFKMACLTYAPSNIIYGGEVLPRAKLLARRQDQLHEVGKLLNSPPDTELVKEEQDMLAELNILRAFDTKVAPTSTFDEHELINPGGTNKQLSIGNLGSPKTRQLTDRTYAVGQVSEKTLENAKMRFLGAAGMRSTGRSAMESPRSDRRLM